jgi:FixJ family two-component response regulator
MPDIAALIIAEDTALRDSLTMLLEAYGFAARAYAGAAECLAERAGVADARLLVVAQPASAQGLEIVRQLRQQGMRFPAIVLSATVAPASRGEAARSGTTIVEMPPEKGTLDHAILAALQSDPGAAIDRQP